MSSILEETSIVICAYTLKRWDQLVDSVDSALAQNAHEVILVIDHNPELYDQALMTWGDRIRLLSNESVQGLSGARNTAIDWAEGGRVAFLDDDATADANWLAELAAPFADPKVVAVGGTANPVWPQGVAPRFMPRDLYWVIGCSFDGQATELEEVRNIMGCSMLFDIATLRRVGGFNTATGRVGTKPVGAEETEACIKIREMDSSLKIMFQPTSVVNHHVSEDRMYPKYMIRRGFYEGISKAYIMSNMTNNSALGTEKAYAIKLLGRTLHFVTTGKPSQAVSLVATLSATVVGYLYGGVALKAAHVRKVIAGRFSPQEAM